MRKVKVERETDAHQETDQPGGCKVTDSEQKDRSTAGDFYKSNCNCAEAVLHAFRNQLPFALSDETMRIATCFGGGGVGKAGFCGAFSGSIMVLSLLTGRSGPEGNREPAYTYAREFGERFVARFGDNSCKALQIYEYLSPEQKSNCGRIIAATGDLLAGFLAEKNLLPAESQTKK
jgi:C_GCAxxG_C_C family probable redox protein